MEANSESNVERRTLRVKHTHVGVPIFHPGLIETEGPFRRLSSDILGFEDCEKLPVDASISKSSDSLDSLMALNHT